MDTQDQAIQRYIEDRKKNLVTAWVLALFFGPLGLMWVNLFYGIILTVVAVIGYSTIFVPVICWILAMFDAPFAASKHNQRVASEAALMANRS